MTEDLKTKTPPRHAPRLEEAPAIGPGVGKPEDPHEVARGAAEVSRGPARRATRDSGEPARSAPAGTREPARIEPEGSLERSRGQRGRLAGFLGYKPGFYSLLLIGLVLAIGLFAPVVAPHERDAVSLDQVLAPPSPAHVLGTDDLGRDVLTRLIYAARFSMLVALSAVMIAAAIGILMGAVSGYFGGAVDTGVTVVMDLFLSVPVFLVLLVAASVGGGRPWIIPLIIGATSWVETSRIVRALVFSLKEEGFVEAARAVGANDLSLVARHVLPQTIPSVIVSATIGFAQAMLVESAMSFLGFGVQPPVPTWGNMLQNAQVFIRQAPLAALGPGFMIFVICLAFNYFGEGLRRALAIER